MIGWMPPKEMSAPFTAPSTRPMATATRTAAGSPAPPSRISLATTTMTTAAALPTETSIPPVTMTAVIPMPTRATGATE